MENLPIWFSVMACAFAGYAVGCLNTAVLLGRWKKVNLHKEGSHNPGTSNVYLTIGPLWGVLVGAVDIGKALLVVWTMGRIFPEFQLAEAVTAVSLLLGNMFPATMRFRGGKGFAALMGIAMAFDWRIFIILGALTVILTLWTDFIVTGTMASLVLLPPCIFFFRGEWISAALLLVPLTLMVWKHRENFRRLRAGTEVGLLRKNRDKWR